MGNVAIRPAWRNWALFAASSIALCWFAVLAVRGLSPTARDGYRVFGSYWASGKAASEGLDPFTVYPLTWVFQAPGGGPMVRDVNLNPPAFLPVLETLALADPDLGLRIWTIVSTILFIGAAGALLLLHEGLLEKKKIVWMLLSPAVLDTLHLGQNYALLFGLATLAWYAMHERRDVLCAVCIGVLVALKPNVVVWPLLLLASRRYNWPAILALAVAGVLTGIPALLYDPSVYVQWLRAVAADNHAIFPTDISIIGYATRLGYRSAGVLAAALLAAYVVVLVVRARPPAEVVSGPAICIALLCSPLAWFHYSLLLVPVFVAAPWTRAHKLAAALLFVPVIVPILAMQRGPVAVAVAGGIYFSAIWIMLAIFSRALIRHADAEPVAPSAVKSS